MLRYKEPGHMFPQGCNECSGSKGVEETHAGGGLEALAHPPDIAGPCVLGAVGGHGGSESRVSLCYYLLNLAGGRESGYGHGAQEV